MLAVDSPDFVAFIDLIPTFSTWFDATRSAYAEINRLAREEEELNRNLEAAGVRIHGNSLAKVLGSRAAVASHRALRNWETLLRKIFGNTLRSFEERLRMNLVPGRRPGPGLPPGAR